MNNLTPDLRAQLRAAHAASTQGEWKIDCDRERSPNIWLYSAKNSGIAKVEVCDYDDGQGHRLTDEDHANAHFIALAHNHLSALLDALDAAQGLLRDALAEAKEFRIGFEDVRQGYQNLLEFRKVGDRYGNLTREELEGAIRGMDAMLKRANALAQRIAAHLEGEQSGSPSKV